MVNENIEKLKEKNKEDPSKFCVPLAEEYKKTGMVDEAISVLLTGLKNQPYYIGAMVALGKLYLQKNMLLEAQGEFEKAVGLAPDNILAHKKLADIYYERGETEKALKEYQSVVRLNPGDEEAKVIKLSLEKRIQETQAHEEKDEAVISSNPGEFQDTLVTEQPVPASQGGEDIRTVKIKDIPVYEIDEEINGAELGIKIPEKLKPVDGGYVTRELEEFRKIVQKHSEKPQAVDLPAGRQGSTLQAEEAPEAQHKEEADIQDLLIPEGETPEDSGDAEIPKKPGGDKISISMRTETMADIFIAQGLYDKAMNIYKEILAADSDNKRIIQKSEELQILIENEKKKRNI